MNREHWGLLCFFLVIYLLPINKCLLWTPDETRYAEISREMVQHKQWIVPKLLGLRYFEKPIAGYWLNNISQLLFGNNRFAVRFVPVLTTGLSALILYFMAKHLWKNKQVASCACLLYMTMLLVYVVGTYSVLDAAFTFWVNLSMFAAFFALIQYNNNKRVVYSIIFGFALSAAFLTKGFLGWVIPAVALLPIIIVKQRWRTAFMQAPWVIGTMLLTSLPWVIAIACREPDYWHYFFWVEHVQRFASEQAQHRAPFWFFIPWLLVGALPWSCLLIYSLINGWQKRNTDLPFLYLLSWTSMPFLLLSIAKGKLITYILPCFAPLALLMSGIFMHASSVQRYQITRLNAVINFLFGCMSLGLIVSIKNGWILSNFYYFCEPKVLLVATLCAIGWIVFALLSMHYAKYGGWRYAAGCPILLIFLISYGIPQSIIDHKQPEDFLQTYQQHLINNRHIISNNLALAITAAWCLKRDDIMLTGDKDEVAYGLSYPDNSYRFISEEDLPSWIDTVRQNGSVAVLLHFNTIKTIHKDVLSRAKYSICRNNLMLLIYPELTTCNT